MKYTSLAIIILLTFSLSAASAPIAIQNHDFEQATELPNSGSSGGFWGFDNAPSWVATDIGQAGIWQQGPTSPLQPLSGSTQSLFVGVNGTTVFQDIGVEVAGDGRYFLSVDVGDRSDYPLGGGGGLVGLYSDSGPLAVANFGVDFVVNGWARLALEYTPQPDDVGENLRIGLTSLGQQANFDNVELILACRNAEDTDDDGVSDASDNCVEVANFDQLDTNNDGFGNACDPDIGGPDGPGIDDGQVNFIDFSILVQAFFSNPSSANWRPDADLTGDDVINFVDLARMSEFFLAPPGPSCTSATTSSLKSAIPQPD